jgi:murein endopeptidase
MLMVRAGDSCGRDLNSWFWRMKDPSHFGRLVREDGVENEPPVLVPREGVGG